MAVRRTDEGTQMKVSALKDRPVISMNEGVKIGKVSDLLIDTSQKRIIDLVLSGEGGTTHLPFEAVQNMGGDAIVIESASASHHIEGEQRSEHVRSVDDLTGLPVAGSDGNHLGDIKEVLFDTSSGQLVELVLHRGGVLGIGGKTVTVEASAIRAIGPKLVTTDIRHHTEEDSHATEDDGHVASAESHSPSADSALSAERVDRSHASTRPMEMPGRSSE